MTWRKALDKEETARPKVALSLRDRKRVRGKIAQRQPKPLCKPNRSFISPPVAERQGYLEESPSKRAEEQFGVVAKGDSAFLDVLVEEAS